MSNRNPNLAALNEAAISARSTEPMRPERRSRRPDASPLAGRRKR